MDELQWRRIEHVLDKEYGGISDKNLGSDDNNFNDTERSSL